MKNSTKGKTPQLQGSQSMDSNRASRLFQQLHDTIARRQSTVGEPWTLGRSATMPISTSHSITNIPSETTLLLDQGTQGSNGKARVAKLKGRALWLVQELLPLKRKEQTAVFKAVLAYAIAGLFPFVPMLRDWLGDPEFISPHLVTNATIWYYAAKSRSQLVEGGIVACLWLLVTSMMTYVALFVAEQVHFHYTPGADGQQPLALQSKLVSLGLFVFGHSWCLAFFKANAGRPSVSTATAMSNIALYLVMLREAPIVNLKGSARPGDDELGESVGKKTEHVLVALLTGMAISACVGWMVKPATAAAAVQKELQETVTSFRTVLLQMVGQVVGEGESTGASHVAGQHKLHGAKPLQLKEALRAHRACVQQLRRAVDAMELDMSVWHAWTRRRALKRLATDIDGLSRHMGSMGAALELRANGSTGSNADSAEAELAYKALVSRIRHPVELLLRAGDTVLAAVHEMTSSALSTGSIPNAQFRVAQLRADFRAQEAEFEMQYTEAVHGLEGTAAALVLEDHVFVVHYFVFGLRAYVDGVCGLLPRVLEVCLDREFGLGETAAAVRPVWAGWRALWDTGATAELEARHESAQFSDPRALHAPRPYGAQARIRHAMWRVGMWVRRANVRFATKYALLVTAMAVPWYLSMGWYLEMRRQRMEWAVISAAAIMVPTVGGSAIVSLLRVLGTCAGGLAAFLAYEVGNENPFATYVALVVFSVPCFHIILHGRYPRIGQFALLTFGVVLVNKWVAREDRDLGVGELAVKRTFAVALGVIAGMLITVYVWPFEARVRVRQAMSWWLLTASLMYTQLWTGLWQSQQNQSQGRLWRAMRTVREYLDSEQQLQDSILEIRALLQDTLNEPRLKGRFPVETYQRITHASQRILDALVAARWVLLPLLPALDDQQTIASASMDSSVASRDSSPSESSPRSSTSMLGLPMALSSTVLLEREHEGHLDELDSPHALSRTSFSSSHSSSADSAESLEDQQEIQRRVEQELLAPTAAAREQRDALISLTMYVLASALVLKTPLPPALPPVLDAQRRVAECLGPAVQLFYNDSGDDIDERELSIRRAVARMRYSFYYTQVMLGWEIVQELNIAAGVMRELYGSYGN
ncbi:hypothetical protein LPJ79_003948 [Coemansia sp. RSA 1821]|nr:hypothetical protein LPJ68_003658 [Coemansia sp. RSA 1086]KAJ1749147.1 hypothetical protein LPJ79_003948 [Coemansia sp. RSA 1821]